jgi:hypothetical protein
MPVTPRVDLLLRAMALTAATRRPPTDWKVQALQRRIDAVVAQLTPAEARAYTDARLQQRDRPWR